jgi:uncharacterized SAM-binding protein YcdF (DUF218 family)
MSQATEPHARPDRARGARARLGLRRPSVRGAVVLGTLGLLPVGGPIWLELFGRQRRFRPGDAATLRDAGPFDAVIVPGAAVRRGAAGPFEPSRAFARRLDVAAQLLAAGLAPALLVSGGASRGEDAEADVARAYLAARWPDVLPGLITDTDAQSTDENAARARTLLPTAHRVVVVSSDNHRLRTTRVFGRRFAEVVFVGAGGAPSPFARLSQATYELAAVLAYAAEGRL